MGASKEPARWRALSWFLSVTLSCSLMEISDGLWSTAWQHTELVHVVITGMAVNLASILWLLSNQRIARKQQGGD